MLRVPPPLAPLGGLAPDHPPPSLGGRYVVARLLGAGAQARVYLAWDPRLRQWRAVKVPTAAALEDADAVARFEAEAHVLARFSHPHLLRVLDLARDGALPYVVTELAHGASLAGWIRRNGPMPARMAVDVALQCAAGLHHVHAAGVVHRDVKPANVLILQNGRVALADFGIARVADLERTVAGASMGTLAYVSPEQRSDPRSVDPRADVYSLGSMLHALVTGRAQADLYFAEVRPEMLADVPATLRPVILDACRFERERRFRSMADLQQALERRRGDLPPGRPAAPLLDDPIALPEAPPERLEPGCQELRAALEDSQEDQATFVLVGRQETADDDPTDEAPAVALAPDEPFTVDTWDTTTHDARHAPTPWVTSGPTRPALEPDRRLAGVALAAAGVLGFVAGALLAWGVTEKWSASRDLHRAEAALLDAARPEVVRSVEAAGADGSALEALWFAVDDADGHPRVEAALAFARAVPADDGEGAAPEPIERVRAALRAHEAALRRDERTRSWWVARLTGDLGSW